MFSVSHGPAAIIFTWLTSQDDWLESVARGLVSSKERVHYAWGNHGVTWDLFVVQSHWQSLGGLAVRKKVSANSGEVTASVTGTMTVLWLP